MQLAGTRRHFCCEYCGRFHFPEETADGVAILEVESDLHCPVCSARCCEAIIEGECVVYCVQCRGFLTRTATFGRIVARRRAQKTSALNSHRPFDPAELRRALSCPKCGRRMATHAYGGGGNAVVDTCAPCDLIWLDAGELAIIGHYTPHIPRRDPPTPLVREAEPQIDLLDLF
jgi:Zn-finger nucleic acid-binding protein